MKNHLTKISFNSIRFKLAFGVVIILLPLIGMLIYNNYYAINVIHNQVAESNHNMLSLYIRQIDTSLKMVDNYLTQALPIDSNIQSITPDLDSDEQVLANTIILARLSNDVAAYKNIDSIFVYNTINKEFLYDFNGAISFDERESVQQYVTGLTEANHSHDELYRNGWIAVNIHDQYYLLRLSKIQNVYVGAWVNARRLLVPLSLINLGQGGASMLTTENGDPMVSSRPVEDRGIDYSKGLQQYYLTGTKNQYLLVGEKSSIGNFNLIALIPDKKILEKLPYLQWIITVIAFGAVLLIPGCFLLLRKTVLVPVSRILSAMKKVRDGNIETRIPLYRTSEEYEIVNETFNQMIDQIHDLKISVYEEQLNKQRAELEYLQLQINPHFFMNSLNIIYRMAQDQEFGLIQEMAKSLLKYFRYVLRSNLSLVPLRDELEHVKNYIRIQELRFSGGLTCTIDIPEFLNSIPVPLLIIQSFIENSVKYALSENNTVHLSIQTDMFEKDSKPYLKIFIRDTGGGFPEKVLDQLNEGDKVTDERGEHTGIWNLQRRLRFLYAGNAGITFRNGYPTGAIVEIELPLQRGYEEKGAEVCFS